MILEPLLAELNRIAVVFAFYYILSSKAAIIMVIRYLSHYVGRIWYGYKILGKRKNICN